MRRSEQQAAENANLKRQVDTQFALREELQRQKKRLKVGFLFLALPFSPSFSNLGLAARKGRRNKGDRPALCVDKGGGNFMHEWSAKPTKFASFFFTRRIDQFSARNS
jgi:hypothetical protein